MPKSHEPRPVSPESHARLEAWARRKPRLALMGEFSSGKSTLLNLLVGEDLLPTRVTATELPPVWFSYGPKRAWWVDRQGNRHELGFGDFGGVPRSARYVRVLTPAPFLERADLIDTPGISDPNLEDESWRFPVGQANFVLWCTPATQAWRETERSTWLSLPERLRSKSVLVVTRADKLAMPGDREKVARRLSRESFGLFGSLVFLSSLDAVRGRQLLADTADASVWARSGGPELEARIQQGIDAARAERLEALERYQVSAIAPRRPVIATVTALPTAMRPWVEPAAEAASPASEPVRPRRVELPDRGRTERPAPEAGPDPLGEIRAGWMALRSSEAPEPPATVLRLTDPVRPTAPEVPDIAASYPAEEPIAPAPQPEEHRPEALDDAELETLLAEANAVPEAASEEASLPRAVRLWREIVAASPEIPSNGPLIAMIDQLLCALSRDDEQSGQGDAKAATIIQRNQAA